MDEMLKMVLTSMQTQITALNDRLNQLAERQADQAQDIGVVVGQLKAQIDNAVQIVNNVEGSTQIHGDVTGHVGEGNSGDVS